MGTEASSLYLAGVALLVELAQAAPLAEQSVRLHLNDGDAVGLAQRFDQLLVRVNVAVGSQHAQTGNALVQHLGTLVQSTLQAVVDARLMYRMKKNDVSAK